jgi:hypothetical protein
VFDQIHCSGRFHCSFGWFIGEFGRFIDKIGRLGISLFKF